MSCWRSVIPFVIHKQPAVHRWPGFWYHSRQREKPNQGGKGMGNEWTDATGSEEGVGREAAVRHFEAGMRRNEDAVQQQRGSGKVLP